MPPSPREFSPPVSAVTVRGALVIVAWVLSVFGGVAGATTPSEVDAPIAPAPLVVETPESAPLTSAPLTAIFKSADLGSQPASPDVHHVANWAVRTGNHEGLPFAVVDKRDGNVFVFGADGRLRGASPALLGSARGDQSVPGIGNRPLSSILPEERTTPAGRFRASMGRGPKGEDILWVDYEGALALHRVVTSSPKERRLQRLASNVAADRRITYGCIYVPVNFFETVVVPAFGQTQGIVYILPELRSAQELFGS